MRRFLFLLAIPVLAISQSPLRLPQGIKPTHYQATLDITPGSDTFSGTIEIGLKIEKPVAQITLHAKEIQIRSVLPAPAEIRKGDNDLVTLMYSQTLPAGETQLRMEYTGAISRVLTDGAFQQKQGSDWYVFTKFEPITARRVFPCFDEPGFKVPWQLSLRVPADQKAFSNTPAASEEPAANNMKLIRFQETKPLPSYLVAFAVGPFEVVETAPVGRNQIPSRIVVPKGRVAEAEYAAAITPKLVEMLEGYFGTPYPYQKLDQVVVPLTTAWGAMENAGMIAYGADLLLTPKTQDSELRHQRAAGTMEHEMSHQWFGDLVTMQWWNDLWLNEAFASWVSGKLVAGWHPEWRINETRAAAITVFHADSLTTARKIRQPIESAGDIGGAFDGITYGKGQAVIAMFEHFLGEAEFQKGVQEYLKAHAFGNAASDDLFVSLDKAAPGRGVGEAFGTFLNQVGFPIVNVSVDCGAKPQVRLTQERMVPLGSSAKENAVWNVPVCLSWATGSQCVLLKKPVDTFELNTKDCPASVFADSGAAGYYAATYAKAPDLTAAGTLEKASFARNGRLLFSSGLGDMPRELSAAAVTRESDPVLVRQAASMLGSVSEWVIPDERSAYAARIQQLYGDQARKLGWRPKTDESSEVKALRLELLPLVADEGRDSALSMEARMRADAWLKDRSTLDAEVVSRVLFVAARNGGRDLFDTMAAALRETKVQRERSWIIAGMAGFRDASIAEAALQLIGAPGPDPRETSALLFSANSDTRETTWKYVQTHFDELNDRLPSARGVPFGTRLPDVTAGFCDASHAADVEAFFRPRLETLPGGSRSLARAVEGIRLCAAAADLSKQAVTAFLRP